MSIPTGVNASITFGTVFGSAEQIGAGDLSHRAPVARRDEIGQLASGFNLMVEHLVDRSADLRLLYADEPALPAPTHRHPRNVRILPPSRDFH